MADSTSTPPAREAGDAIEREREAPIWREALTLIAGTDPLDAALDPQRLVGLAKQALAATPSPSLRIAAGEVGRNERIAVGSVNLPGVGFGDEYDEPEVQPYLAVLEQLQARLVPFTNSKGVTLELFVDLARTPGGEQR